MQIKSLKIQIPLFFLLNMITFSCVHQSLGSNPDHFHVILQDFSATKSIFVKYGFCIELNKDSTKYYHINLDHLQGGRQKLFGIITISEHNPNDLKRIIIADSSRQIAEYSINEIMKMDTINIGSQIVYRIK